MSLKKSARYYRYTGLFLLTGLALVLDVSAARAGFEWIQTSKTPEVKDEANAPEELKEPANGPLMPVPEVTAPQQASPAPAPTAAVMPMSPAPVAETAPTDAAPVPLLPAPAAAPVAAQTPAPVIKTAIITPAPTESASAPVMGEALAPTDRQSPATLVPTPVDRKMTENKHETIPSGEKLLDTNPLSSPDQPAAILQSPINPMPAPVQAQAYAIVDGFGEDVPLALALSQVVPPEYGYSFATDVNPGLRVSWNGGKPWNQVVSDMIAPLGLHIRVNGNAVRIYAQEQSATPVTPAVPMTETAAPLQETAAAEIKPIPLPPPAAAPVQLAKSAIDTKRRNIRDPGEFAKADQVLGAHIMQHEEYTPPPAARSTTYPGERPGEKEIIDLMPKPASTLPKASDFMPDPTPVAKSGTMAIWEAAQGESLRTTLLKWTARADVELVWNAAHDYTVDSSMMVNDTFQNALKTMLTEGLRQNRPAIRLFNPPPERGTAKTVLIVEDSPQNSG